MNRRLGWAVACVALLALGFALIPRHKFSVPFDKEDAPNAAAAPTSVVALYDARPTRPPAPDPLGVHVADVGIGPKGAKLLGAGDPEISQSLKSALAELAARPFLPAMGDGGDGSIGASETKPGDERYAWAVGGFLRERTGLRYEVRPYVKPK